MEQSSRLIFWNYLLPKSGDFELDLDNIKKSLSTFCNNRFVTGQRNLS